MIFANSRIKMLIERDGKPVPYGKNGGKVGRETRPLDNILADCMGFGLCDELGCLNAVHH